MAIQTKEFTLGSTQYGSDSNGYALKLTLTEESVSVENNTSCVSYRLQLIAGSANRFDWQVTGRLLLDGALVAQVTREGLLDYNETWTLLSGMVTLPHREDGALTLPCVAQLIPYNGGNRYTPPEMTLSEQMTLTPIDRESTVQAQSAMIESICHVTVERKNPAFTHTLQYTFGQLEGYLAADGSTVTAPVLLDKTAVDFYVPAAFYGQIPNAPSGQCILTVCTYLNGSPIGTAQSCQVELTADPALCSPVLTVSVEDQNGSTRALTGDSSRLVRYCSDAACTVEATAQKGATLESVTVNGQPVTETVLLTQVDTDRLIFQATDSRGYSTRTLPAGLQLLPYIMPDCLGVAKRTHPTDGRAEIQLEGNWFGGSFGAADNALWLELSLDGGDYVPVEPTAPAVLWTETEDTYRITIALEGLHYEQTHTIGVRLRDRLSTVETRLTLGRGVPVFDWGKQDFAFHVPVTAPSVNDRGSCNDANSAVAPGCYLLNDPAVGTGILLVWTAGDAVCQLAISRDGSVRKWRLLWDGAAGNWNQ